MVSNTEPNRLSLNEATQLRQQAAELLQRLMADRELSERRSAETGKRDPMKFITGRTALDGAIASTREMIGQVDSLLATLQADRKNHELSFKPALRQPSRPQIKTIKQQFKSIPVSASS